MSDLERYEAAAAAIRGNLARLMEAQAVAMLGQPGDYYFLRHCKAAREAEERDRREWLDGVKQRLGLVVAGEAER